MKQKSNKGGRPKLPEGSQREKTIRFRATAMEQINIEENARKAEQKTGDYLREVGQYSKVYARISAAELHIHRDYIGAINNLNRLTALAYKYGMTKSVLEGIREATNGLRSLIDRIRNPHRHDTGEEVTDELKHFDYDSQD